MSNTAYKAPLKYIIIVHLISSQWLSRQDYVFLYLRDIIFIMSMEEDLLEQIFIRKVNKVYRKYHSDIATATTHDGTANTYTEQRF